jgi:cytochrome c oxidase assembly factor CtaG
MTFGQFLIHGWQPEPGILGGCALLLGAYCYGVRPLNRHALAFTGSILVLPLALISPLDTLGDTYLFSVHMVQHLLLTLVVPPLLLLGLPGPFVRRVLRWPPAARIERTIARPLLTWSLAIVAIWVWHLPALYDAALRDGTLHIVEHLCFLATATLYWWPVIAPHRAEGEPVLAPWATGLYLFTGMAAGSLLGIIITFAAPGLYPFYDHPADPYGLLATLRTSWRLTPADDQQLGGALMWIIGGIPYVIAIFVILARWFAAPDDDPEPYSAAPANAAPANIASQTSPRGQLPRPGPQSTSVDFVAGGP